MAKSSNLYVGMDVHKDSIDIALADGEGREEVRHYGSVRGASVPRLWISLRRWQKQHPSNPLQRDAYRTMNPIRSTARNLFKNKKPKLLTRLM